jgi:hypothetical protein
MTPISQHVFKPSTIVGLSLFGIVRFGVCILFSFAGMALLGINFIFALIPPTAVYLYEFAQTKREPDRDTIFTDRFMTIFGRIGLQDSKYPPSLPVPNWKTDRTFYGP